MKSSSKWFVASAVMGIITIMFLSLTIEASKVIDDLGVQTYIVLGVMYFSAMICLAVGSCKRKKEKEEAFYALPQYERERIEADRTIEAVMIIGETMESKTKASTSSAVARGVVGGALFGPIGAVAGAATPKTKTVTKTDGVRFSVKYKSGRIATEWQPIGSSRYNELMRHVMK